jgi:predicted XRE-type DNA-binding protein
MIIKNAFTAMGLDPDEATIDTLRTDLALALRAYIERSGKGQTRIGEILGLTQNVVSHIARGEIEHLSVERLIKAMVRAGIPGFAEWGESSEQAHAGSGFRPSHVSFIPVFQVPNLELVPGTKWTAARPANASQLNQVVRATTRPMPDSQVQ